MTLIDYSREPHSDIAFIDMKSFYASVECVERGLHPLTTSLCVMSSADNSAGLILASSPTFKKVFGKKNVGRAYDLPFDVKTRRFNYYRARQQGLRMDPDYVHFIEYWAQRSLIVPPRMGLYIERNLQIQKVLQDFAPPSDVYPYSIDEGFIDLSKSLHYFTRTKDMRDRRHQLDAVAEQIQHAIWKETGIYSTVGLSNANPLLAKLALDNEAKKTPTMRANWSYEDVETKVWRIPELTDFWGIGSRMALRLNKLGIESIRDLAHANPDKLKQSLGVIGLQLFFHAHGVDESKLGQVYTPKSKALGNSQVLPRDYYKQSEIELVLAEMAEQVAIRLRRAHKKTCNVAISVGYARQVERRGIHCQRKIDPTQNTRILTHVVIDLFRQHYQGGAVRNIAVRYGQLVEEDLHVYSLFEDHDRLLKEEKVATSVDQIRQRFGHVSVLKASALMEGSRTIARSRLIGGHSAGGAGGLDGLD